MVIRGQGRESGLPQQSTGKAAIWMAGWLLNTLALTVAGRELGHDIPVFVVMSFRSLIAMAILSWLIAFNVVNTRNPVVHMIAELLYRLTEPVLRPIRNMLPNMGGIDISPIILFLIILFIQSVILPNIAKLFI